jgi:hypothetical protein
LQHQSYPNIRAPERGRDGRHWPTGLTTLAGRQGRFLSKFRHDRNEARRLSLTRTSPIHSTLMPAALMIGHHFSIVQ